jgi:NADH-quinone oxidoreductase subunit G
MDRTASVCPNCSQGCNMIIETRDNVVVRLRPRPNESVNKYFMCDHGRLNYRWLNRQDRVDVPMVRANGALATADWERAVAAAGSLLAGKRAFVLASPRLPNETLYLLSQIMSSNGAGAFRVDQGEEAPLPGVEGLARRKDLAANVRGAELFGFKRADNPLAGMQQGDVLIVADEELAGTEAPDLAKASAVIVIGTTLPAWARHLAAVVLPIANMSEEEGTFTNVDGRVQRFMQAKAAPGYARPSWWVASDVLQAAGGKGGHMIAGQAFEAVATGHPEFAGLNYDALALGGRPIKSAAQPAGAVS